MSSRVGAKRARYLAYFGVFNGQVRVRLHGRELAPQEAYSVLCAGGLGTDHALALPPEFDLYVDDVERLLSGASDADAKAWSLKAFVIKTEPGTRETLMLGPAGDHALVAREIARLYEGATGRPVQPATIARYLREDRRRRAAPRRDRNARRIRADRIRGPLRREARDCGAPNSPELI